MHHDDGKCECYYCKFGFEEMQRQERKMIEECGFFCHYVFDDHEAPLGVNAHTHGLVENFDHDDFQIVAPVPAKSMHGLFWNFVNRIKEGERFFSGQVVENIAKNYKVKLVNAEEEGRIVLRIIVPDQLGNYERGEITGILAKQYDDLEF